MDFLCSTILTHRSIGPILGRSSMILRKKMGKRMIFCFGFCSLMKSRLLIVACLMGENVNSLGNTAQLKRRLLVQAPVALPRCFAEILCPDFGFGSLREFRPRCRSFTVIHQVLPQNCASSVRKIHSQITLVQLCGIASNLISIITGAVISTYSTCFLYYIKSQRSLREI